MNFDEYKIKLIEERLAAIEQEKAKLLSELAVIRTWARLKPMQEPASSHFTGINEKIHVFLDLFRCREDVYPRLWENAKKGTKGYSPVCHNEWIPGICRKPGTRCSQCCSQSFAPLDEEAVMLHLEGKSTIGTYAITRDDTCKFLAVDFDKSSWRGDVKIFKEAAGELGVNAYIEISRSGNGAHVWIFFTEFIPAATARKLASLILLAAETKNAAISLDSYDRFFPNQDFLPKGGFGNLIALPLQHAPGKNGNSVLESSPIHILRKDIT